MTKLEILKLALEGAKANLGSASHCYEVSIACTEDHIDRIRAALNSYDEIKELIEECKESNRA